jgi:hypothetical protein
MIDGSEVRCPNSKCGAVIGTVVAIEGIEFLKTETLMIRNVNSVCLKCGTSFHRSINDKQLEKVYKFHFGFVKVDKT